MEFTINDYIDQHNSVIKNFDSQEVEQAIKIIKDTIQNKNRIAICGNGGSALTASHYITDWNKMIFTHTGMQFDGICLSDNIGLVTAYANDFSYNDIFSEQVKNLLKKDDLLITVSGSGNSENVVRATVEANKIKVHTLSISGFDGGKLKQISKNSVWIKSFDMQLCEDAHIVFGHMVMKSLCGSKIFTS